MKTTVNTTAGKLNVDKLGDTLIHEHIFCGSWEMRHAFGDRWTNTDAIVRNAVEQLKRAREFGITTIVEGTPINLGRDIALIAEVAEKSGMQIIVSSGLYTIEDFFLTPVMADRIIKRMIQECTEGMENTEILPGILKCGTDINGITRANETALYCVAQTHKATGLPIFAHSVSGLHTGYSQLDYLNRQGVDISKVIIGHCGETDDFEYFKALLESGCFIGIDRFNAIESKENTTNRLNNLVKLKEAGLISKVMVSEDHWIVCDCLDIDWDVVQQGGDANPDRDYTHFHRVIIPQLRDKGFTEEDLKTILRRNPTYFFAQ